MPRQPSRRSRGYAPTWLRLRLIDGYVLSELVNPMTVAVIVILIALLLFRALEIFNFMAGSSARFAVIPRMIADLVPQYLGLAAPGAYFISMFLVVARMGDTSEIDAILASGYSIVRLTLPLVALGVLVSAINLAILGFAQPFGRYGFNAHLDDAIHAPWDARAQPRTFIQSGENAVLSADAADPTGRLLKGVFIRRVDGDGREQVFTAARGALLASPDQNRLIVTLLDGQELQERNGPEPVVGSFNRLSVEVDLGGRIGAFRGRGLEPREMTLLELPVRMASGSAADRRRAASELNTRIVRTLSVPILPLLAVPAGMAAKRRRRAMGTISCGLGLFLYENAIDVGQNLSDRGVPILLAIWTPFLIFAFISAYLFQQSIRRPGQTPFTALSDGFDATARAVRGRLDRRVVRS